MNRRSFFMSAFGAAAATCAIIASAEAMPAIGPEIALAPGPREDVAEAAFFMRRRRRRVFFRRRRRFR